MHFALFALFALSAVALPSSERWQPGHSPDSVVYFLENNPAGSNLVSLEVSEQGQLSNPVRVPTGGKGSLQVNATGSPGPADSLGSQGAVVVKDNLIFTVNAGSNTLSLFFIEPWNPCRPKLIGTPADTLGEFPISVAYSRALNQACVLNGGAVAGVACFTVDPFHGLKSTGPLRPLPKDVFSQTTPPSGPPNSAAQIQFNPESTAIFVTLKGNPGATPVKPGSLLAWPVSKGREDVKSPVVTQFSNVVLDFGFQFIAKDKIFLSDPSFGVSILTVQSNLTAVQTTHTVIAEQKAICWTQYWRRGETLYAIDAGVNNIYTLDANTGALKGTIKLSGLGTSAKVDGAFDSAISGGFMHSLTDVNGISTVDLGQNKQTQYLDLTGFGNRQFYQGMASYPSHR